MKIEGNVALVVGAARGVGLAFVEALLNKGAKVCFGDTLTEEGKAREVELQATFGKDRLLFVKCDVTKQEDVDGIFATTLEKFSKLDIVVNNAAIIHEFQWQLCFDVNVFGVIRTTQAALKHMGKDQGGKGGVIINTSSVSGLYPDYWGPVYCATKHASLGYTRALALPENYNQHGVRLNLICPASIDTKFIQQVTADRVLNADLKQQQISQEKLIPTSEVAKILISLIEDDTKNGAAIQILPDSVRDIKFLTMSGE